MDDAFQNTRQSIVRLAGKYRKILWSALAILSLYSVMGLFFAPWLINKTAVEKIDEIFGAKLALGEVTVNPFTLSLRIEELQLHEAGGESLSRIDEIFINFQLSSLFRWAWTFDEFHINGPEFFFRRDESGTLNLLSFLAQASETTVAEPETEGASPARLLVFDFAINESVVNWNDDSLPEPVETRFGPINIAVQELNTLPQRAGQQMVVITTETSGTFSWQGSLQLNPLNSVGTASIKGSHFPLTSAYLRHQTGYDIVEGLADVALDYVVSTETDGHMTAAVNNFELGFQDVLVRTFTPQASGDSADRDLLHIRAITLSGGEMRWPEKTLSVESISIDDAALSVLRDETGRMNIVRQPSVQNRELAVAIDPVTSDEAAADDDGDWQIALNSLSVNRMSFRLEDYSVVPFADVGLESLDLIVSGVSNEPGVQFPTELILVPNTGGTIELVGTVSVLPDPIVDLELSINDLKLAGGHPYIKPLADVNLDSGALNLQGHLLSSNEKAFVLSGDLSIVNFLITETDEGSRLGSWSQLDIRNFAFDRDGRSLEISEIEIQQPYGDIVIAADGTINLGRVEKTSTSDVSDEDGQSAGDKVDTNDEEVAVTIGRVMVVNAAADFADYSLPLPFAAKIADLNGSLSTIATTSSAPSTVTLEGGVDEFGAVRISGTITPFETSRDTDIKIAFQNVEMPKFSAYTIPFAGREIASGRLDLSLGYKVTASELIGENKIVFRDLELGEKVPHPGAMSLPLGLAVALLKDAEGKIDIDLPIRGNVDDPEFRYGGVIMHALGNLVIKIVASPFALLGNLLGVDASELEYMSFLHGRADLTPPEVEKARKLAEALTMRPGLILELKGVIDREADTLALKTARLDEIVAAQIEAKTSGDSGQTMYAQHQKEALELLFSESGDTTDATAELDALRVRFTSQATEGEDAGIEQFDELAYINELRDQLIAAQRLAEAELAALANARADKTRLEIIRESAELDTRIRVGEPGVVKKQDKESVRMKLELRTGKEDEIE